MDDNITRKAQDMRKQLINDVLKTKEYMKKLYLN